jgi:hypothetical protein
LQNLISLFCVLILAGIHIFAPRLRLANWLWHTSFLSAASGISASYVFVQLLPELCQNDLILKEATHGWLPYVEKHAFLLALAGFLFFYGNSFNEQQGESAFPASLASYGIFNFLVGYALADVNDPDVRPYSFFTFAMGVHYFVNDHELSEKYPESLMRPGRKLLVLLLLIGWLVGYLTHIPEAVVSLIVAFVAGGVIMNTMRHQLKHTENHAFLAFTVGAIVYSIFLLIPQ